MPTTGSLRGATSLDAAAEGRLPTWARVGEARRAHIVRVAGLMEQWAAALDLPPAERRRWRAAAWLHDALRDAPAADLAPLAGADFDGLPGSLLHGPAAAALLRREGADDVQLLHAIAFHTLGDASFETLGRALYAADFLEPGRSFLPAWRAVLRARMPAALDEVVTSIVGARIDHLLACAHPVHARTIGFWNRLAEEHHARPH